MLLLAVAMSAFVIIMVMTIIVITALIFSAFHLDPVGFLARFELGAE